jgi:catechol 2,3-dioxygenase-like lactoylglutathione lyase family enzyme
MFSHVFIGIGDFDRAFRFYSALAEQLGLRMKFCDPAKPWAGWMADGAPRPLLLIGKAFDGAPATPGNGQMIALLAGSRETVDRAYQAALDNGATCDGPPGIRPQYHADYYGAYVRDPDGNKLCVCCHVHVPGQDPERFFASGQQTSLLAR